MEKIGDCRSWSDSRKEFAGTSPKQGRTISIRTEGTQLSVEMHRPEGRQIYFTQLSQGVPIKIAGFMALSRGGPPVYVSEMGWEREGQNETIALVATIGDFRIIDRLMPNKIKNVERAAFGNAKRRR